jgi:acyl-CoA reductase-like NAD-dependent aldehyde dehydrogenase
MTTLAFPPRDAYIDGKWVTASKRFPVLDPWDGSMIAEVVDCEDSLVDEAIDAAAGAFAAWRVVPAGERGRLLAQMAARMLADVDRLAAVAENGAAARIGRRGAIARASCRFGGEAERDARSSRRAIASRGCLRHPQPVGRAR